MSTYRDKIDDSSCHFCARQTDIEGHHIVPQRFNGSDARENLVGVCERCHKKLEALYDKRFYETLGISDESGERKGHFECEYHECGNRAEVKISTRTNRHSQRITVWRCLSCATEEAPRHGSVRIAEDMTGKFATRLEWVKAAEGHNQFKSIQL